MVSLILHENVDLLKTCLVSVNESHGTQASVSVVFLQDFFHKSAKKLSSSDLHRCGQAELTMAFCAQFVPALIPCIQRSITGTSPLCS